MSRWISRWRTCRLRSRSSELFSISRLLRLRSKPMSASGRFVFNLGNFMGSCSECFFERALLRSKGGALYIRSVVVFTKHPVRLANLEISFARCVLCQVGAYHTRSFLKHLNEDSAISRAGSASAKPRVTSSANLISRVLHLQAMQGLSSILCKAILEDVHWGPFAAALTGGIVSDAPSHLFRWPQLVQIMWRAATQRSPRRLRC